MKKNVLLTVMIFAIQFAFSQEYLISFEGNGASNTIDSICVQNLTQETTVTLYNGDSLLLNGSVGVDNHLYNNADMQISPNPMKNESLISFFAKQSGAINISVFEFSGKKVLQLHNNVKTGYHKYKITGLKTGAYLVHVTGDSFNYSSKLISQNKTNSLLCIDYLSFKSDDSPYQGSYEKSITSIVNMNYNTGDQLLFKGYSYNYTTIVTDVPTEDKTIDFNFIECIDYDGNNYAVVQIGDQIWMAESIKTTHYRNGTPIPNVTDNDEWTNLETGAYCWYENDISHKAVYGALYNWYTAVDENNIAPEGWHVPSKAEIMELTEAPGGTYSHNGGTLKETGNEHWNSPNTGATNETGFSALGCGYRYNDSGTFDELGTWCSATWTTEEDFEDVAWYMGLEGYTDKAYTWGYWVKCGFSIRCIKD